MSVIKDFEFGEGIFHHYIIKNIFHNFFFGLGNFIL